MSDLNIADLVRRAPKLELTYAELQALVFHLFPNGTFTVREKDGEISIRTGIKATWKLEVFDD